MNKIFLELYFNPAHWLLTQADLFHFILFSLFYVIYFCYLHQLRPSSVCIRVYSYILLCIWVLYTFDTCTGDTLVSCWLVCLKAHISLYTYLTECMKK